MISVIIPAFNEEATLARCLCALEAQTLNRDGFEVILVDNCSTDRTVAVGSEFLPPRLPLRIATKVEPGVSGVRNYGAHLATGEMLAFLDADCIVPPSWLEHALRLRPQNAIWGADYRVPANATWVGRVWMRYQARERQGNVSFIPAGCLFVAKDDLIAIGGFDTSVETSEDVELCARAMSRGMDVIAIPPLAVSHEGTPRTLGRFYRQNRWHGQHVLRVFLSNLPSRNNIGVVGFSAYTFLMIWISGFGLLMAFWRMQAMYVVVPLILLLLPTLLLSLRKTIAVGRQQETLALWVLYQTYFFARAASLAHGVSRGRK